MPKMKSHSSSKKRFKVTKNGKVKRAQAFKKHILTKKTPKRKRQLRANIVASEPDTKKIRRLLPYK